MSVVKVVERGSIGFVGALYLIVIAVKLMGLISWSWPVVLIAPVLISIGIGVSLLIMVVGFILLASVVMYALGIK